MRLLIASIALLFAGAAAADPVPVDQLAKAPAGAQHFTIMSTAGKHGDSWRWTTADGTRMGREHLLLRGQLFETDSSTRLGRDGMIGRMTIRGFTPNGDAAETFDVEGDKASWKSVVDAGSAPYSAPAMYISFGGPVDLSADALEALLAAPDRSLPLLPGGRMRAEKLTTATVGDGPAKKTVTAWAITGLSNTPFPAWSDDKGRFFAAVGGLSWIAEGYEAAQPILEKAQTDALAAQSPLMIKKLVKVPPGPVAFVNVRAFVDGDHFADGQTVVVEHGKITAVGPADQVKAPAGAQTFDGAGKTLSPGLWDSHMHYGDDFTGPMLLSLGITSARDPGNINALTIDRAKRRAAGLLLSPRVYPSVLIDGKGPNTAQVATVANSQQEAIGIVDKAKADGFTGIKFYGTYTPAWVAPAAAEAHRLGLHVHGHLPAGMRPSEAIDDGYDELTHIYFVMMQAMPDDVVAHSNGMARFEGTGRYAKDVDLDAEPMKSLIAKMAARHIVSDPTLVVVESLYMPENGDLSPSYAPFVGSLPPAVERGFRQGGFAPPAGVTREDYRKSFHKLEELVGRMHKAGIQIVAGTDGSGMELVRELELYVDSGFTPAEALEAATIVPARNVHADGYTGSIAVGKDADLVLVDGDPSQHIGDLRHTRVVMMGDKLMDADALRAAGGFEGRPKFAE